MESLFKRLDLYHRFLCRWSTHPSLQEENDHPLEDILVDLYRFISTNTITNGQV